MPIVEVTMIEGYDADAKQRLVTSLTRAVRSVMAAPPEGVVVVFREVKEGSYARGGVARKPGPAVPPAEAVVRDYLAQAPGVDPHVRYEAFHEALADEGALVAAEGSIEGEGRFVELFEVSSGAVRSVRRYPAA